MEVVIGKMGLPPRLCWPLVRWGAKIFGGFDPEEYSPMEAVKRCTKPVIFFHGEADDFVPCCMSRELYDACPAKKAICTVPGADHGLSFPVDMEGYVAQLLDFFGPEASAQ
jgi:fermentation-respiration switch protein FrsA (DUF1100 family)